MTRRASSSAWQAGERDALWYKDAIIYQLHVRAYHDSDDDGMGDFAGLTHKLDYLQDLGVTALWLLPFYPSPLRDDGYDIADYMGVHPSYGTLRDFQTFLREARHRGLRVITELVLNHSSDEHPWFQRARRSPPGSKWRDYYVWSDTPDKYRAARVIFKDFESSNWTRDPVADAYYWHRFYAHQPDLNFDNPEVHQSLLQAVDFWLGMGVDGLRLDAVPYLYEREGTSCENLPETHEFLRRLRTHVDKKYQNRMLLAEANQWPEDAAAYFGNGDECHMNFHFPLMPRLFMAVQMEDRFPIIDILEQTPPIPDNCQWGVFLRNHDELTLEMVTDEDRDYMYRVYAEDTQARINLGIRRRLAPLLGNNRRRIELLNGLLFSLPGAPIIYYGDEIGMGDNIYLGDRNGVRTPMQWSGDRNAGFSRANPQRLYLPVTLDPEYHYETVNVEAQHSNPHSLFWWMKRLIALRKRHLALSRGTLEFLYPENRKVLTFVRRHADETILVIVNLSRFVQYAELDISNYKGAVPVELFGQAEFPRIGDLPYFITLGPHAFYWFSLQVEKDPARQPRVPDEPGTRVPVLAASWEDLLAKPNLQRLEAVLPDYLRARRWFGGKARAIQAAHVTESVAMSTIGLDARMLLVRVEYVEGEPQTYQIPIALASGARAQRLVAEQPDSVIARLQPRGHARPAVIYEATANKEFLRLLLDSIRRGRRFKGGAGQVSALRTGSFRAIRGTRKVDLEPALLRADQSNTSVAYGDRFIMKLVRRPVSGVNPDLEIGRFLTERSPPVPVSRVAGYLEYQRRRAPPITLAILQELVHNEGDAWSYTLDSLRDYMERILPLMGDGTALAPVPDNPLVHLAKMDAPEATSEQMGGFLQSAELLGQRTGDLHAALAAAGDNAAFSPEPFTPFYQRSIYQGMRANVAQVFPLLRSQRSELPEPVQEMADRLLNQQAALLKRFRRVTEQRPTGMRIRVHGDLHLNQVLFTGKDFVIIDFEGEPARPLSERRLKRSPLRDVSSMLRSLHYAAYSALFNQAAVGMVRPEQFAQFERWSRAWYAWAGAAYLRGYFRAVGGSPILPQTPEELQSLLDAYLLEKAVYEVGYELNNRPDWVRIPLAGILQLLETPA